MLRLKWSGPTTKHVPYKLDGLWMHLSLNVGSDNLCPEGYWKAASQEPAVKKLLDAKLLEVVGEEMSKKTAPAAPEEAKADDSESSEEGKKSKKK